MNLKRTICLILAALLILSVPAASANSFPCISYNACKQSYKLNSKPVVSYLMKGLDGTLVRVDYANDNENANENANKMDKDIFVETFNDDYTQIEQRSVIRELDRFCGLYVGKDAYYAVYSGANKRQSSKTDVFRVVKYDPEWHEIARGSVRNVDAADGCVDSNLRMVEKDGVLYVHSSRLGYSTEEQEGENGSFLFAVSQSKDDPSKLELKADSCGLSGAEQGYFAGSLDQYIGFDGGDLITVDVTESAPRGVILARYKKDAEHPYCITGKSEYLNVLPFFGEDHDYVGASVGGFEITPSHYLIAGNTAPQDSSNGLDGFRNVFVSVTDKKNFTAGGTAVKYLTDYNKDSGVTVSTPHLVRIGESKYMVMWNENDTLLKYVVLDAAGNVTGEIKSCPFTLSDCKPTVFKNKLIWYSTANCKPAFYELPIKENGFVQIRHVDDGKWLCVSNMFKDVRFFNDRRDVHWAHYGIDFCVANGFMNGTSATEFSPDAQMNRAMLVTVLWRMNGAPGTAEAAPFTDLKQNWYKQAVAWAYKNKIVNGISAARFDPTGSITREQAAAILYRYSAFKSYAATARADISQFPDAADVHDYAKTALSWAVGSGLIVGVNRVIDDEDVSFLSPRGNATRAQVATILMRYCSSL